MMQGSHVTYSSHLGPHHPVLLTSDVQLIPWPTRLFQLREGEGSGRDGGRNGREGSREGREKGERREGWRKEGTEEGKEEGVDQPKTMTYLCELSRCLL